MASRRRCSPTRSRPAFVLVADPAKNTEPTAQQRVVDFVGSSTAYEGEAVNIFIPVQNKFVDDHTASTALTYKAAINRCGRRGA